MSTEWTNYLAFLFLKQSVKEFPKKSLTNCLSQNVFLRFPKIFTTWKNRKLISVFVWLHSVSITTGKYQIYMLLNFSQKEIVKIHFQKIYTSFLILGMVECVYLCVSGKHCCVVRSPLLIHKSNLFHNSFIIQ